jgi:energy-coupling factor transporter ATP-binding protein EcfA2
VLPERGLYCLASPSEYGYGHQVVDTIEKLTRLAKQNDNKQNDTFFAVGTLKELKVWDAKKKNKQTGEVGAFAIRTHANMNMFKSLILDIDCAGVKRYEYPNQQEALNALKKLSADSGLPKPTIVNSGRGLHCYWTFAEAIDVEAWHELSIKASLVYSHFGLKVDPSRVKDKSSVLRVAGTHHYKDRENVRDVTVIIWGEPTPVAELEAILTKTINFYHLELPKKHQPKSELPNELSALFADVESNLYEDLIDIKQVYNKCPQMARVKEVGGSVGYDMRGSAASIIKKSTDKDYSVLWANDDQEDVVKHQTEDMIAGTLTDNPHTCDRFEAAHPGGCRGCQFVGKIGSPIVLGRIQKAPEPISQKPVSPKPEPVASVTPKIIMDEQDSDKPAEEVVTDAELIEAAKKESEIPEPPFPYHRGKGGISVRMVSEDDTVSYDPVYEYDIYPYERVWDYKENGEAVNVRVFLPMDGERQFQIPASSLADNKALAKMLATQGVITQSTEKMNVLVNYMSNYIRELQRLYKSTTNYAQLGWQEDGIKFVMPETTYNSDGTTETCGVSSKLSPIVKTFRKKGTIEEWREVIDVYSNPGYEPYAFAHLAGYGSLLFDMTIYHGAIINLIGNSGSGKSTVLKTINSIYGHPEEGMLMQHDKYLARMNRIGVYNSIPVSYDEITKIPKEELSDLCYSISQGRGRHRLGQDANEKENNTSWKLIMVCSSNSSLYDILGTNSSDSSAEAMRVFEYRMDRQNIMQAQEAELVFAKLEDNFGHAGEIFIAYVATHRAEIKELIIKLRTEFGERANVPGHERYWANIVACNLAGGIIAKKLGLHNFDIDKLFQWAVDQIKHMRGAVSEIKRDSRSLIVDFMNANISSTITVRGTGEKGDKQYVPSDGEPRGGLVIRSEVDLGIAYIPRETIRQWLIKGGSDFTAIKKELKDSGILINDHTTKVLSSGSAIIKSGQSHCWVINTNHPLMAGAVITPVATGDSKVTELFKGVQKNV